ncbi:MULTISPECIES: hypothetical protein [unclassified Streptomyces]|uniref:hypothetical protein n=1 Tax=unclassified Streptomyces TaxID=2593676 RepID=UPI002E7FEFF0|nr:hypothetical protein [Streptomyces sp. NBC_00562]WUC17425.1 hypothetical protein OHA33_00020 [Streptomyces sp. NBC_00562]WUC25242.1 hypothetical protein OHA33_44830 [Streptomyces sp. NBC_00562]
MEREWRALRDVHGRLDELTTVVTERLTTAARRAGQLEVPAVRAIVAQAVDELRQGPLPAADNTAAEDSDDALEQALADAERHPTDMRVVRRLVDEMVTAGGKLGQTALELAPAYLSDEEAADSVLARYADDIGCDVDTILATRRHALTGDRRALQGTWI